MDCGAPFSAVTPADHSLHMYLCTFTPRPPSLASLSTAPVGYRRLNAHQALGLSIGALDGIVLSLLSPGCHHLTADGNQTVQSHPTPNTHARHDTSVVYRISCIAKTTQWSHLAWMVVNAVMAFADPPFRLVFRWCLPCPALAESKAP
jgi:hypothetical protein